MGPRAIAEYYAARDLEMYAEGLEHLPRRGPAIVAARHYHHLYDGAALVMLLPRMLHIFVALDWARDRGQRRMMEIVCGAARWPIVLRPQRFTGGETDASAYAPEEIARYVRSSIAQATELLRERRVLVVFPEGFPAIEPHGAPTRGTHDMLPFAGGFASIAAAAARAGVPAVPIVPAGLAYSSSAGKISVHVRLGEPRFLEAALPRRDFVRSIEADVTRLSRV